MRKEGRSNRWPGHRKSITLQQNDGSPSRAALRPASPSDAEYQGWWEEDSAKVMRLEAKVSSRLRRVAQWCLTTPKRDEQDGEFLPESPQEPVLYSPGKSTLPKALETQLDPLVNQSPARKTKAVKLRRQRAKLNMERGKRPAKRTESTDQEPFTRPESTERREPLPPPAWLVPSIVPQLQWLHNERDPSRKPCSIDRVHELKEKLKKEIPNMSTTEADFLWLALIDMDKNWRLRWSDSAAVFADFETEYGRRALKDYNINHYDSPYTVADRT